MMASQGGRHRSPAADVEDDDEDDDDEDDEGWGEDMEEVDWAVHDDNSSLLVNISYLKLTTKYQPAQIAVSYTACRLLPWR